MKSYVFLLMTMVGIGTGIGSTPAAAEDLTFAVIGDAGQFTSSSEKVLDSIHTEKVTRLILPGDNLYSGSYAKVWSPWEKEGMTFDVVAIGNHHGGYSKEVSYFNMPAEYYAKTFDDRVRFIVLNSDNIFNVKEQIAFLENELTLASEPFVFLVYHHPTLSISHLHKWTEKKSFQNAIRPLLKKYRSKITGLLVGHDHLALAAQFDDLPVFLSGAVHEVRADLPVNKVQEGVDVQTLWYFDWKPYWAKLTIPDAGTEARVEFIRASDSAVRCTIKLETGAAMNLQNDCADSYKKLW